MSGAFKAKITSARGYRSCPRCPVSYTHLPKPIDVIEKNTVKALVDNGTVVITVGGGGIPVVRKDGKLYGTPAVDVYKRQLLERFEKAGGLVELVDELVELLQIGRAHV